MPDKESPKKNNFIENTVSSFKSELTKQDFGKKLREWKRDIWAFIIDMKRIRNVAKNNYELGKKHYEQGNFGDAVFRFKLVTWMDAEQAAGWHWLGKSYIAAGKLPLARAALNKALQLKPDLQEAKDLLQSTNEVKVATGAK